MSSSKFWSLCRVGAFLLAIVGATACGRPAPPESPSALRHNVLLITIDTLRADAVGAYGKAGAPTPVLDQLAAGGARFTNAHAHNVVTLPSHANILTGLLPPQHGVHDNAGFRLPSELETLATHLKRAGYRTGAFVSAFPLDSRFGLTSGFDVYDDALASTPRPAFLIQERAGDSTVEKATAWIASSTGEPWFAWVHIYEPHFPYAPPQPFRSRWPRDPYIGEVAAADAALRPLLNPVFAAGTNSDTLVIVTSDHGEALGEHGEASHGIFAYESVLRVPLVLHAPRLIPSRVVDAAAQHVDVLPTVLEAVGLPVPEGLAGRSLLPAAARGATDGPSEVYFEALSASLNRGWAPLRGLLDGRFKYIDLPLPELYDLGADPSETRNLVAERPELTAALRTRLAGFQSARVPAARAESAETRERLRSLGYVTGRAAPRPAHYGEDDDPKRLIELDRALQDIVDRYLAGDLNAALTRARELVRRRPTMAVSWMQLAQLERDTGNVARAIEAMRRAASLRPGDPEPLALLGGYLTASGRAKDAVDLLNPHAGPNADPDLLSSLALALARLERFDEAVATLERARAQDPASTAVLMHLGTVQLSQGQLAAARDAFTAVVRLAPQTARAHSSLGVVALEDARLADAAAHWRRAGALDAAEYGTVLALGLSLARAGRVAEARAALEFFAMHAPPAQYSADLERTRAWLRSAPNRVQSP